MDKGLGSLLNPNAKVTESVIASAMNPRPRAPASSSGGSQDASFCDDESDAPDCVDDADGESSVTSVAQSSVAVPPRRTMPPPRPAAKASSREDVLTEKATLLFKLDRMEKSGERLARRYTLSDDLNELRTEVSRLERDRSLRKSIKFQQSMLISFTTGLEFLNNRFDPFGVQLEGWSESVNDGIDEYSDVFAELHDKYSGKSNMPPELRLVMMLAMSAFMFHLTNSMFKSMPGMAHVMKQNPGLARDVAAATAKSMAADHGQESPMGGIAKMFGGMFGAGQARPVPAATVTVAEEHEDIFSEMSYDSTVQEVRATRDVVNAAPDAKGTLTLDLEL